MKKNFNSKLALNRETLRTLTGTHMAVVVGGITQAGTCTTGESNTVASCETCVGPSCHGGTLTATGTSSCC